MSPFELFMPLDVSRQLNRVALLRNPERVAELTTEELIELTNQTVLWVKCGNHDWAVDPSILAARLFAGDHSKFIRGSGYTECTHAIGAADLIVNLCVIPAGQTHPFGPIFSSFANYNHDRVENNRDQLKDGLTDRVITNRQIIDTCWLGDPQLKEPLYWFLEQMTDSYGLEKEKRLEEQVKRANNDKTGLLGELRITEKLDALNADLFNATFFKVIPFNEVGKALEYIELRADTINAITSPRSEPIKQIYMSQADKLTGRIVELMGEMTDKNHLHFAKAHELKGKLLRYGGVQANKKLVVLQKPVRGRSKKAVDCPNGTGCQPGTAIACCL